VAGVRVTMTQQISGNRNGEPWPPPGEVVDLPKGEATDLVQAGLAEPATRRGGGGS
jgi:hypothetical protein